MTPPWCCQGNADGCPLCYIPSPGDCPGHPRTPHTYALTRAAPHLIAALGAADVPLTRVDILYAQIMTLLEAAQTTDPGSPA